MAKVDRMLQVLLALHTRRRFTAADLAQELGVSRRTALRYLQELSAAGVPLASRPGPGGGYLVLRDRTLPLAFSIDEAVSLFFAYQALENYGTLPFDAEIASALRNLYQRLPVDAKERIDRMRERLRFATLLEGVPAPHLGQLLAAAVAGEVVEVVYRSAQGTGARAIQPIGVYAQNGLWYCPAYCFQREGIRSFRVDRVLSARPAGAHPAPRPDIAALTIADYYDHVRKTAQTTMMEVQLTVAGLRRVEHMDGAVAEGPDGGRLRMEIEVADIPHFASTFLAMGTDARVLAPPEMVARIRDTLARQIRAYDA